jgi:hypothetical protein
VDEAAARLVIDSLVNKRECERFQLHYKTNPNSTLVAVIFNLENRSGRSHWIWRPQWMLDILKNYVSRVKAPDDSVLVEAFDNLKCVNRPDPNDKTLPMFEEYTPPRSTKVISLPQFTSLTYFSIPYHDIPDTNMERDWIDRKCVAFLEHIRTILAMPFFKLVMLNDHKDFADKIYQESRGTNNLPGFLNLALTRVQPFNSGTDHVMKEISDEITSNLYLHRIPTGKYPVAPVLLEVVEIPDASGGDDDETSETGEL